MKSMIIGRFKISYSNDYSKCSLRDLLRPKISADYSIKQLRASMNDDVESGKIIIEEIHKSEAARYPSCGARATKKRTG